MYIYTQDALAQLVRRGSEPFISHGDAHLSQVGSLSRRISRCWFSKERAHHTMPKDWKRRILYVGSDLALLSSLQNILTFCKVVRCPRGKEAQSFIEGIDYSALLFDEQLLDMTADELTAFVRQLESHRQMTPIVIVKKSGDANSVIDAIVRELSKK
jgi:hypothetical protein